MSESLLDRLLGRFARKAARIRAWHRWPYFIGVTMIVGHRVNMRRENLTDTEVSPPAPTPPDGFDVHGMRRPTAATTISPGPGWG
jgi:hypothetical protein